MTRLVREYKAHPDVRDTAIELTSDLLQKDYYGEVQRLFQFVQHEIRYMQDVTDIETLQTPEVTLQNRVGDCDDKATLLAALLESIGHPTRFQAVGFAPGEVSHVFVETRIGTRWIALDATEPNPMGWQPPLDQVRARITRHN